MDKIRETKQVKLNTIKEGDKVSICIDTPNFYRTYEVYRIRYLNGYEIDLTLISGTRDSPGSIVHYRSNEHSLIRLWHSVELKEI